ATGMSHQVQATLHLAFLNLKRQYPPVYPQTTQHQGNTALPIQSIIKGFPREYHLTESEICYIIGLNAGGLTHEAIAWKVSRNRSTITKILQRYNWPSWNGNHY